MKSVKRGTNTSEVEVLNISSNGVWLYVSGREYFADYEKFPWFKDARIMDILKVTLPSVGHLYWPNLDIDLSVESLEYPEKFPRISKLIRDSKRSSKKR